MFKDLIFVQELTVPEDGEIRIRILSLFKQNPKINLQFVAEEGERIENLRHDMAKTEERSVSKINAVKQKQHKEKNARKINPCYGCGGFIII